MLKLTAESPADSPRSLLRADFGAMAGISHGSLALPLALGIQRSTSRPFVVREYIEGADLESAVRPMGPEEMLPWLTAAASALSILHRFGVAHGNIKLSNFLVPRLALFARRPRGPKVVICDPAWWRVDTEDGGVRASGASLNQKSAFATDVHAFGAVFYRLLTGEAAEPRDDGFPAAPSDVNSAVPVQLSRVVMKLLHPDPDRRYAHASGLLDDLARLAPPRERTTVMVPECFLGRESELKRALQQFTNHCDGAVVAVAGEGGIGRSSFLRRVAVERQLDGDRVVFVQCHPATTAPSAALHSLTGDLLPPGAKGWQLRSRYRRLLGRADVGPEKGGSDLQPPNLLAREVVELFATATEAQPTVLIFDDLHVADGFTIRVVASFLRHIALKAAAPESSAPLSVAVSYRSESPFLSNLEVIRRELETPDRSHCVIELARLPEETIERWVELAAQDVSHRQELTAVASQLGGDPFAVYEALRAGPDRLPAAPTLDAAVLHRNYLESLKSNDRRVLELLAALGRPVGVEFLGEVFAGSVTELRRAMNNLQSGGALREEAGQFSFRHSSFRFSLWDSVESDRRRALHRRVAEYFERSKSGSVVERAHHWLHSDSPQAGFDVAVTAARELMTSHEYDRALEFFRATLDFLPFEPSAEHPVERSVRREGLLEETAEACHRAGRQNEAVTLLQDAFSTCTDKRAGASARANRGVRASLRRCRRGASPFGEGAATAARDAGPEVGAGSPVD